MRHIILSTLTVFSFLNFPSASYASQLKDSEDNKSSYPTSQSPNKGQVKESKGVGNGPNNQIGNGNKNKGCAHQ